MLKHFEFEQSGKVVEQTLQYISYLSGNMLLYTKTNIKKVKCRFIMFYNIIIIKLSVYKLVLYV